MSIVTETWAVCGGCGDRAPGSVHPSNWLMLERADAEPMYFCSNSCLVDSAVGQVPPTTPVSRGGFSPKEVETIRLVAEGRTNAEIAQALHISESTLANRLMLIGKRSGGTNSRVTRLEIVLYAHALGVINLNHGAQIVARRLQAV